MKERPILFNTEMVRAILEGRKTQTRRLIKPQPYDGAIVRGPLEFEPAVERNGEIEAGDPIFGVYDNFGDWGVKCPFGIPGDRLWVRETFSKIDCACSGADTWMQSQCKYCNEKGSILVFKSEIKEEDFDKFTWTPSIHMPRWASRINLEITNIRVERVQDISESDVSAEGHPVGNSNTRNYKRPWFQELWDSIEGESEFNWNANPWVWVIEFKKVEV